MPLDLEALLRATLSATGTEAFVWDLGSDTITRMRAGAPPQATSQARARFLESIEEEDRAALEAALQRSIETRTPLEHECRSAGRWLCIRGRYEGDWLFGTICDVTSDRNRRSSFEQIIDNIPDFISRVDLDGRFVYLNRAGETNVYGLPRSALIGKTPEELGFNVVTAWMLREGELRVIETGQQQRIELVSPGKLTGRTLDVLLIPERDESGRIVSILRVTRDVTPMKEAEARWRRLAEAVPQLVWVADTRGKIVYCNPRWYEYTGRRDDETLGDAWSALVHPDDREPVLTAWRAALAAGTDYVVQARLLGSSGAYRWFLVRGVPARNEAGLVTEWFGTCTDIHDEIERQEELHQSRARLALAVDAAEMAVFTQDLDLYYTWLRSPRGGFTEEQVLAHSDYDLVTDRELIEPLVEMKREALRTRKRMGGVFRLRHPPDDRELWWDVAVEPMHDAFGQVSGLVGTARDVTAVKHAEIAMRESEERLQLAARASLAMIYDWNMATNVTYRSDAVRELTGYSPEETRRSEWWLSNIHPEDRVRAETRLQEAIANGRDRYENEYRIGHRDGTWRYLWDSGFIVRDASGRAVRAVGSTVDVTARRLAEEELKTAHRAEQEARTDAERANRAKDDFLATLSHELRTPMTSILGWTSMLSSGMVDAATMPLAIGAIHDSAQAQAQLIEDLLDVSRITAGKLSIEMRPLDLVSIVASSVESFRVAARTRSIDLRVSIDASDLLVLGDEKRVRQIVANLISNALKFTPAGGRVDIGLRQTDGNAFVVVRDTGVGIAPQFLPHIFDRFSQQDTSGSREHGGLGLGLAIVHELVEMHGGRVSADSAGIGRGSVFTVTLPRVTPASRPLTEPASSLRGVPRLDGVRVLLVEDEPHSRKYMESVLTSSGAEVQATASVAEALAAEGQPEVVVSDIAMPGEDGISLITKLRTRDALTRRRTPALAVTALGFGDDRRRILSAGFDEYLSKPVEPMQLLETVAALVRK